MTKIIAQSAAGLYLTRFNIMRVSFVMCVHSVTDLEFKMRERYVRELCARNAACLTRIQIFLYVYIYIGVGHYTTCDGL